MVKSKDEAKLTLQEKLKCERLEFMADLLGRFTVKKASAHKAKTHKMTA